MPEVEGQINPRRNDMQDSPEGGFGRAPLILPRCRRAAGEGSAPYGDGPPPAAAFARSVSVPRAGPSPLQRVRTGGRPCRQIGPDRRPHSRPRQPRNSGRVPPPPCLLLRHSGALPERAAASQPAGGPLASRRYYFWLAHTYSYLGNQEAAAANAQTSIEAARRSGDTVTEGRAWYVLCRDAFWSGYGLPAYVERRSGWLSSWLLPPRPQCCERAR
jgi:hypothetical protein